MVLHRELRPGRIEDFQPGNHPEPAVRGDDSLEARGNHDGGVKGIPRRDLGVLLHQIAGADQLSAAYGQRFGKQPQGAVEDLQSLMPLRPHGVDVQQLLEHLYVYGVRVDVGRCLPEDAGAGFSV